MKAGLVAGIALTVLAAVTGDVRAGQRQDAPSPTADLFVTVNGMRIHYVDWGNPAARPF